MTATETGVPRRRRSFFFEKYPRGKGVDIGCGPHALNNHIVKVDIKPFPKYPDLVICDATTMDKFADETFDYVYSSHCLEHLDNPGKALWNWYRILKTGGYLIVVVPHRDYYEKRKALPSHTIHHKCFFLPFISDFPDTISLYTLITEMLDNPKIVYLNECCEVSLPYRTVLPVEVSKLRAETGAMTDFSIEAVVQKKIYTPIFELNKRKMK